MATSTGKEAVGTRRDSLEPLIRPASIAVIGASSVPSKAGHQLLRALDGFAEAGPEGAELQARAATGGRATGAATAAGGARLVGPLDEDQAKGVLERRGWRARGGGCAGRRRRPGRPRRSWALIVVDQNAGHVSVPRLDHLR